MPAAAARARVATVSPAASVNERLACWSRSARTRPGGPEIVCAAGERASGAVAPASESAGKGAATVAAPATAPGAVAAGRRLGSARALASPGAGAPAAGGASSSARPSA